MRSHGDGGRVPPGWRAFDPPRLVWVDVPRLHPSPAGWTPTTRPTGLRVSFEVPGLLHAAVPSETGEELGLVSYTLTTADSEWDVQVHQYVLTHLLKPRSRQRRDRAH